MKRSPGNKTITAILASILLLSSCRESKSPLRFTSLSEKETGIAFSNTLTQTSHFNIIEYLYFYNGGGVSAGDINNDGLVDLYFTANQLQNRLYLNKGDFVFEDITSSAGVAGEGNWKTGTTMADVNGDGLLDIFICGVGNYKLFNGRNQLLINNGDLTFTDRTEAYGLMFQGLSTHASFFDYDNDGDLDMYLVNHSVHSVRSYGTSSVRHEKDSLSGDRLYRNELIPSGEPGFTDVTDAAGIFSGPVAYGLSVSVSDVNLDGFMDIYVANDFHENDYFYVNQHDGTFTEELAGSFPHTSRFSMGSDIADVDNDGLPDIITLDMLPRSEEVIKTTAGEDPYDIYSYKLGFGYHHQFARNALQLNRGFDNEGRVHFSDIAPLAGVEATDWSWAPLFADLDNDGNKDLFVANGIVTRPNDLDYINFISSDSAQKHHPYLEFIRHMPSGSVPNYVFRNTGHLNFQDVSPEWIGNSASVSTGAAYADLDNDGDLDLVINNINENATILKNETPSGSGSWLQLKLEGKQGNQDGIGAKVHVFAGKRMFYHEQILSRGWQSSMSPLMHIGLGDIKSIDSVRVIWPDGTYQTVAPMEVNNRVLLRQASATGLWDYSQVNNGQKLFTQEKTVPFDHEESRFNAFNSEKLIPHMITSEGPALSTGDVNGDGLDDFFIGGGVGQSSRIYHQKRSGDFFELNQPYLLADSAFDDTASSLFDANGDGWLDLIVVSGGQQVTTGTRPRLYLNNGRGMLVRNEHSLPEILPNSACIKTADYDNDGDIDVFIGGRVVPGQYSVSPASFLLVNNGDGRFSDESWRLNATGRSSRLGMVTDAVWSDINEDGQLDLVVVGEWMPVTVLIQDRTKFSDRTVEYGMDSTHGWWNALQEGDFDGDGDTDLVAGNLGRNSRLHPSATRPVTLFTGDIDENGGTDHLLTYYNGERPHPFISRDQLVKQVPSFRRKFLRYSSFKDVKQEDIIPASDMENFLKRQAYCFSSVLLENRKDRFAVKALTVEAQTFPIFAFATGDFNGDGKPDLIAAGNLHSVQPDFGRYDAGYGLMMLNDGAGNFTSVSAKTSGFVVQGESRSIALLTTAANHPLYIVGRNGSTPVLFKLPEQHIRQASKFD